MCTVTIIPLDHPSTPRGLRGGLRLVTNRDESRNRPTAERPAIVEAHGVRALYPIDPQGGGTWVGVNDQRVIMSILNYNPRPHAELAKTYPNNLISRGNIIPTLIDASSSDEAIARLRATDLSRFAHFRLVIADLEGVALLAWDRASLRIEEFEREPVCVVSSGLGDDVVQPRLPLFDEMVRSEPTIEAQDAFHAHQWPDRTEQSVRMARSGARTVSVTSITLAPQGPMCDIELRYRDDDGESLHTLGACRPKVGIPASTAADRRA